MNRILSVPFFLLALGGIYFSITFGLGDIYAERSSNEFQTWRSSKERSLEGWNSAFASLDMALSFAPNEPSYNQRMSRLYRSKVTSGLAVGEEQVEAGQKSLSHLRASLEVRPFWGPAWADLALTKALVGEFDDEYFRAFENAALYGPWEPSVIHILTSLGRGDEKRLTESGLRAIIVDAYVRGLRSPVKGVYKRTLTSLGTHLNLQAEVIDSILPFVSDDWPRGKSDDFFNLTNGLWPHLTGQERDVVFGVLYPNVSKFRNPAHWIRNSENEEILVRLCQRFTEDGVTQDLSRWCK